MDVKHSFLNYFRKQNYLGSQPPEKRDMSYRKKNKLFRQHKLSKPQDKSTLQSHVVESFFNQYKLTPFFNRIVQEGAARKSSIGKVNQTFFSQNEK